MRRLTVLPLLAALGLGIAATPALAHDLHFNNDQCNFSTDYDVYVTPAGVRFERDDGTPAKVFMHGGQLSVDGRALRLSAADADSVRRYEAQIRTVLPEVVSIAREGVDIGYSALTTVAATFARDGDEREHMLERLNRKHADALHSIDRTLGRGEWRHDVLEDTIRDSVEDAVPELVSSVTADAVKAALSGDQKQIDALQARADSLDRSIDREVDARADKLSERAEGLCSQLATMDTMQERWQFRLPDGSPLQLLIKHPPHDHDHGRKDHDHVASR